MSVPALKIKLSEVYKGVKIEVEASIDDAFAKTASAAVRSCAFNNLKWAKEEIDKNNYYKETTKKEDKPEVDWDALTKELGRD